MKVASIEIFKNNGGTVTICNNDVLDYNTISFPIEMIPTVIDCLNIVYKENNGKSEILEDEDE